MLNYCVNNVDKTFTILHGQINVATLFTMFNWHYKNVYQVMLLQ